MSTSARAFAAHVQLPCRVFCGPESILEVRGLTTSIDTGSLILELPAQENGSHPENSHPAYPELGESVRLELTLPSPPENARPKYLAVRARVAHITEMKDG